MAQKRAKKGLKVGSKRRQNDVKMISKWPQDNPGSTQIVNSPPSLTFLELWGSSLLAEFTVWAAAMNDKW